MATTAARAGLAPPVASVAPRRSFDRVAVRKSSRGLANSSRVVVVVVDRRRRRAATTTTRAGINTDADYNCVVRNDGVIISSDIPSGVYEVSSWWHGSGDDGDPARAPRCDSERQRGCEVRCEMTAEGELVCEGLTSGRYRVINAEDADAECSVEDGAFECTTSFDDDGPPTQDTGDVDLQESEENKSFRMGG
tara:strand:- start:587 stop:1165 length:579 start_codon:yes stop_codon:yes gene_type:complete